MAEEKSEPRGRRAALYGKKAGGGEERQPVEETEGEREPHAEAPGAAGGGMMARHMGERADMHSRHEKERMALHGAHRDEHRAMEKAHEAEHSEMIP